MRDGSRARLTISSDGVPISVAPGRLQTACLCATDVSPARKMASHEKLDSQSIQNVEARKPLLNEFRNLLNSFETC